MIKSKRNTSISWKNCTLKDMDTIIISTGVPPILATSIINFQALSRQSNVPSVFSTRTNNHSSTSSILATPRAPTFHPCSRLPTSSQPTSAWTTSFQPYMYQPHRQMGHQPFQNTPYQRTIIPSTKSPNYAITPKYPP